MNLPQPGARTVAALVAAAAIVVTTLAGAPASATGAGSCTAANKCYMNYQQGNYYYGYAGNDDALYETFNNGYTVGDNVQKARNRESSYSYMCVYNDPSYYGLTGWVPFNDTAWVSISRWTSSHKSHTSAISC